MLHLLQVSISKRAVLKCDFTENLPMIVANVTQVRQVILNLVTNASEAVSVSSGVISVTTGAMDCDDAFLENTGVVTWDDSTRENRGGLYVYFEVIDTGCGMPKEVVERIFDPFFTTKLTGRGLGLAATLGIMRAHRGALKVQSEEGKGSTFRVLFPVPDEAVLRESTHSTPSASSNAGQLSGTVLLVDDEESIRALGRKMLERFGLSVLTASDGREALNIYRQHGRGIDLVLLDLTMPHMDGHETFCALRSIDESAQVVLCSGFTVNDVSEQFAGKDLANIVQKPYTSDDLFAVLEPLLSTPRKDEA
jgi:CheY-like chemotaxis protein